MTDPHNNRHPRADPKTGPPGAATHPSCMRPIVAGDTGCRDRGRRLAPSSTLGYHRANRWRHDLVSSPSSSPELLCRRGSISEQGTLPS